VKEKNEIEFPLSSSERETGPVMGHLLGRRTHKIKVQSLTYISSSRFHLWEGEPLIKEVIRGESSGSSDDRNTRENTISGGPNKG